MNKIIFIQLLLILLTTTAFSQELVTDFEEKSLPVLNDQLNNVFKDVDGNTDNISTNTTDIAAINSVPQGLIAMWSGAISAIPAGWELCDGSCTITCPDLTDRFIIHADADSGGTNDVGDTGGVHSVTLTAAQSGIAEHSHNVLDLSDGGGDGAVIRGETSVGTEDDTTDGVVGGAASAAASHENRPKFYALAFIIKN